MMNIRIKPTLTSLNLARSCPSGEVSLKAEVDFVTPGGMKLASKSINAGWGDSEKVAFSEDTFALGGEFLRHAQRDIEAYFASKIERHLGDAASGEQAVGEDEGDVPI